MENMAAEDYQRLAQDFIDAINSSDWDRCKQLLASEVVLEERTIESQTNSPEDLIARLQEIRDAAPGIKINVDSWMAGGDGVVAGEVTWTRDDLETDGAVPGTIFLSIDGDRLRAIHELHAPHPLCGICMGPPRNPGEPDRRQ